MTARINTTPKPKIETTRSYEMEKMHLFDTQADEEKALCGVNVPAYDLTGVDYYLERMATNSLDAWVCYFACPSRTESPAISSLA